MHPSTIRSTAARFHCQRYFRAIKFVMKSLLGLLSVLPLGAAGASGQAQQLSLSGFQGVLRTGLDSELEKIASGPLENHRTDPPDQRHLHTKRRSSVRRRTATVQDIIFDNDDSTVSASLSSTMSSIWDDLLQHAWNTAQTIGRNEHGGLSVTEDTSDAHAFPFLVCAYGGKQTRRSLSAQDTISLFGKQYDESLVVSSKHNETCVVITITSDEVQRVLEDHADSKSLVALPLLDITKIHAGTVDEVTSEGWAVPYHKQHEQPSSDAPSTKNETEAINEWERMIVVDFVPGLGGMKEEAQLLKVVNDMMGDIQDFGEVGWLRSMGREEAEEYTMDESLVGVPALSDLFSLTSLAITNGNQENGNPRITFWRDSLRNGIESEHACSEMFSTLFVKPRPGYYGYDLVLNPSDGPPPRDRESSASNPACVTSLLAALATHPHVLSVKANFPIYHGWNVAQKLDAV